MKKKFLAAVLSMSMVLGMGTSVFAADATTEVNKADESGVYGAEISAETDVKVPKISVTVPSTMGKIALNPYKMEYEVDSTPYKDQIVSIENEITNASDVAVAVNVASLQAEVPQGSGVTFATADLKGTETTKSVFMYLEFKSGDNYKGSYDAKSENQLLVGSSKAASKAKMVTLDADGGDKTTANFKFEGKVASNPAKSWAEGDKFTVKLKFTFTPQVVEAAKS